MSTESKQQFERAVVAPILLFLFLYCAVQAVGVLVDDISTLTAAHVNGLVAALIATLVVRLVFDRRALPPMRSHAFRNSARAVGIALLVVGGADLVSLVAGRVSHAEGAGMPWRPLLLLFAPAALHEELVFRGSMFRRLAQWRPIVAIVLTSIVFALAHGTNQGVTPIALLNIAIGGVLLALVRLELGFLASFVLHFAWNALSGPLLGHEVSGSVLARTLLTARDRGPAWLTGGTFGLEGSVPLTCTALVACFVLARMRRASSSVSTSVIIEAPSSPDPDSSAHISTEKR